MGVQQCLYLAIYCPADELLGTPAQGTLQLHYANIYHHLSCLFLHFDQFLEKSVDLTEKTPGILLSSKPISDFRTFFIMLKPDLLWRSLYSCSSSLIEFWTGVTLGRWISSFTAGKNFCCCPNCRDCVDSRGGGLMFPRYQNPCDFSLTDWLNGARLDDPIQALFRLADFIIKYNEANQNQTPFGTAPDYRRM